MNTFGSLKNTVPTLFNTKSDISQFFEGLVWEVSTHTKDAFSEILQKYDGAGIKNLLLEKILEEDETFPHPSLFQSFPKRPLLDTPQLQKKISLGIATCIKYLTNMSGKQKSTLETQFYGSSTSKDYKTSLCEYLDTLYESLMLIIDTSIYLQESESEKISILSHYFQKKYSNYQEYPIALNIEIIDIILVQYHPQEQTLFGVLPYDIFADIIKWNILSYISAIHLSEIENKNPTELENIVSSFCALIASTRELKKSLKISPIVSIFLGKQKIPEKKVQEYQASALFQIIKERKIMLPGDQGEDIPYGIQRGSKDLLHQLIFGEWFFLCKMKPENGLILYLLGLIIPLSEVKRNKILTLSHRKNFKKWDENTLLVIMLLDIEDFGWLDELGKNDILHLGDICLEKNDRGSYENKYNLSCFSDFSGAEMLYLLSLDEDAIQEFSQKSLKKEDIFGVQKILEQAKKDIFFLPENHKAYSSYQTFIEHTPKIGLKKQEVISAFQSISQISDAQRYIDLHRKNYTQNFEDMRNISYSLYHFCQGNLEIYSIYFQAFGSIHRSIQEKILLYFSSISKDKVRIIVNDNLVDFCSFLTEQDLWDQDLEISYDLFCDSKKQTLPLLSNTPLKNLSLKEELREIFGEDFGNTLYNLPFSEKVRRMLGEIGRNMNGYFQQRYIIFLEGNISQLQKNIGNLEEKSAILEKILLFLSAYGINTLENPTKLFSFVFFGNIQFQTIDDLYDFFEDYEVSGKNFSIFVQSIMSYLKNSDLKILEKLLKTSQDDDFIVQKVSHINQVATLSFRECERKLFKLGFERNPGKGGHIKYTKKDTSGNFIFIILPHGADANINRYLVRSTIKKLFLTREQWHNL